MLVGMTLRILPLFTCFLPYTHCLAVYLGMDARFAMKGLVGGLTKSIAVRSEDGFTQR